MAHRWPWDSQIAVKNTIIKIMIKIIVVIIIIIIIIIVIISLRSGNAGLISSRG